MQGGHVRSPEAFPEKPDCSPPPARVMSLLIFRLRIGLIHMEQKAQMMFYLLSLIL